MAKKTRLAIRAKELLDFVLIECGDMKYWLDGKTLIINEGFDMERIYYAYILMKEKLGFTFKILNIEELDITEIPEGFLEKMELDKLMFWGNDIRKMPLIPDSVEFLDFNAIGEEITLVYDNSQREDIFRGENDFIEEEGYKISGFLQNDFSISVDGESFVMIMRYGEEGDEFENYICKGDHLEGDSSKKYYIKDKKELHKILSIYGSFLSKRKMKYITNELKGCVWKKK